MLQNHWIQHESKNMSPNLWCPCLCQILTDFQNYFYLHSLRYLRWNCIYITRCVLAIGHALFYHVCFETSGLAFDSCNTMLWNNCLVLYRDECTKSSEGYSRDVWKSAHHESSDFSAETESTGSNVSYFSSTAYGRAKSLSESDEDRCMTSLPDNIYLSKSRELQATVHHSSMSSSSVCLSSRFASSAVRLGGQRLSAATLTLQSPLSSEHLPYATGACHIVNADTRSATSGMHTPAAVAAPPSAGVTVCCHLFDSVWPPTCCLTVPAQLPLHSACIRCTQQHIVLREKLGLLLQENSQVSSLFCGSSS